MTHEEGKLAKFLAGQSGYFRTDCNDFPWHSTDRSVWYALLVVEDGEIIRCGFTSSKPNKAALCDALRSLTAEDEVLLLGIWTGQYSTHLFVVEPAMALECLEGKRRFARFEHLRNATDVVKAYGPRGGFRCQSGLRPLVERSDLFVEYEHFRQSVQVAVHRPIQCTQCTSWGKAFPYCPRSQVQHGWQGALAYLIVLLVSDASA